MLYKEVQEGVEAALKKADEYYGTTLPRPNVRFDLKGTTAGTANYPKGYLRFNIPLGKDNRDDFLEQTVPHEVAHWVQGWKYGWGATKPHGREWKGIMMQVFRLKPERCHDYDVSKVQTRKLRRYTYHCGCRSHQITSIIHNKIRKGQIRRCKSCRVVLTFGEPVKRALFSEEL